MKYELYIVHVTKLKIIVASAYKGNSAPWKSLGIMQSWYDDYTESWGIQASSMSLLHHSNKAFSLKVKTWSTAAAKAPAVMSVFQEVERKIEKGYYKVISNLNLLLESIIIPMGHLGFYPIWSELSRITTPRYERFWEIHSCIWGSV